MKKLTKGGKGKGRRNDCAMKKGAQQKVGSGRSVGVAGKVGHSAWECSKAVSRPWRTGGSLGFPKVARHFPENPINVFF